MAWKWFKNDWNIAGILLFFAQLAWAVYFISILFGAIFFLLEIFVGSPLGIQELTVRIRVHQFSDLIANSRVDGIFQKSIFETSIDPIKADLKQTWSYYLASIMTLGLYGLAMYGLTLLKHILRNLRRQQPWSAQNSKNLKTIGHLMVLAVPYKYAIGWLSYLTIHHIELPANTSLIWPPVAWELGLAGLAVLLVAYILEEGTRLYEEQKLTV
ncbi:hypothetical protein CK503_05110 [Aliifodinibius salipaludis]|uniref:DUF2975 domain-containing protein n=1 Tax=Fodinibius salipaludis TaxID=2032627 RepID=A0A2A2GD67_9BACT|nr:DUF2975 domain-containing protein [Aliifodinibius salipaludis]PAU94853.1 hypothetical protein CK503_05110 [Aliifodinibius salipaludis]